MKEISLEVKYQNNSLVDLRTLTKSLNGIAFEYDFYCKHSLKLEEYKRRLLIKEVRQGSYIFDFLPDVAPLIQEFNSILQFNNYLKKTVDYFTDKTKSKPVDEYSMNNCNNLKNIVNQTATDNNSSMIFNIAGDLNVDSKIEISTPDANKIQNNLEKYKGKLIKEEDDTYYKQAFRWSTTTFSNARSVDKGIIEEIHKKPFKIIFLNDEDKKFMTEYHEEFKKDWQDLIYIVDVKTVLIQEEIKSYKILKVYQEDTIID